MAQIPFRANLQTQSFPLLSELSGRTVIVGQQDQTYVPGVSVPQNGGVPADIGVPQLYYAHNIMPSTYGYQSVGYRNEIAAVEGSVDFKTPLLVQGAQISGERPIPTGTKCYMALAGAGASKVYVMLPGNTTWMAVNGAPTITATTKLTVATVNGVSYINFSLIGTYIYNNFTNTLIARVLDGIDKTKITDLAASNGYLAAFSQTAVSWSSVVDVEDFVPTEESGAGGGSIQELKGAIITTTNTSLGLLIFSENNVVSMIYSGNADFPWNFKEVPSSGGISSPSQVSLEQIAGYYQTYSTNGMQQIGHTGAKTINPQITDFVSGSRFEDYDMETDTFTETNFNWTMRKAIAVVADRYVVVSYGLDPAAPMTHAIVLDVTQGRMGKLRVTHTGCFELRSLAPGVTETPRGSLAFIQTNGVVKTVDFGFDAPAPDAVLFLGKYQMVRQRMTELHEVELENVNIGADFSVTALPTLDGKTYIAAQDGYLLEENPDFRRYTFRDIVGTNISLRMKGRFNMISLLLWMSQHGRR